MFVTLIATAVILLPAVSQSNGNRYGSDQVASVTIPKSEIPTSVIKSVNTPFNKDNPATWSKFPSNLKEYGWMYEINGSEADLTRYEVNMRTSSGNLLWASYDSEGNLIETRETSKDIPLPRYVQEAIFDSPYKDWTVTNDHEVIRYYQGSKSTTASQDFRLTVEKGNSSKKLGFRYSANKGKYEAYVVR